MPHAAADRIAVGLHPRNRAVEALVARAVVAFAAEVSDVEILDLVAAEVEAPTTGVSTTDLALRAGITYRQAHHWTASGYLDTIAPTTPSATGPGYPLHYTAATVVKARIMGSLVSSLAMAPARAAEVAEEILAHGSARVAGFTVTSRGLS